MYNRLEQWKDFCNQMEKHIVEYTQVQYGNTDGNEQVDNFTPDDCWQNMLRYFNRRKTSVRGSKEKLRDVIKIAHYAQLLYDKLKSELGEEDVY